jgi:hypothetical protein
MSDPSVTTTPVVDAPATPVVDTTATPIIDATAVPPVTPVVDTTTVPPVTPVVDTTTVPPATPVVDATAVPPATPVVDATAVPPATPVTVSNSIVYTWNIVNLTAISNLSDFNNLVINATYKCTGTYTDASNNVYTSSISGIVKLEEPTNTADYIPYESLTEEIVLSWIMPMLNMPYLSSQIISDIINQITPYNISMGVPWTK